MIEILFEDKNILVCIKPSGTISELCDSPLSLPKLIEAEMAEQGKPSPLFTVHRLDKEVCGVMVFAKTAQSAKKLSEMIANRQFSKEYLAVVSGQLDQPSGTLTDLLFRDSAKNKTFVVDRMRKGVKDASLDYFTVATKNNTSLLRIKLHTGRTHQIRVQLSSRGCPIIGDRKYGSQQKSNAIALCSHKIEFSHPTTKKPLSFTYFPNSPEFFHYSFD